MNEIIEALKALAENPDDLSTLPQVISKLEEKQQEYTSLENDYQERIIKLQQANRSLLSQIPIAGNEPQQEEGEKKVTFEEAQEEFINAMQNVGGNTNV